MPRTRSPVWHDEFFKKVTVDNLIKAECQICMLKMSVESGRGTSSLFRHLITMHKAAFEEKYLPKKKDDDQKKGSKLSWWKENQSKYPSLATIARCYLALPPTSVLSELFSEAGIILIRYVIA